MPDWPSGRVHVHAQLHIQGIRHSTTQWSKQYLYRYAVVHGHGANSLTLHIQSSSCCR